MNQSNNEHHDPFAEFINSDTFCDIPGQRPHTEEASAQADILAGYRYPSQSDEPVACEAIHPHLKALLDALPHPQDGDGWRVFLTDHEATLRNCVSSEVIDRIVQHTPLLYALDEEEADVLRIVLWETVAMTFIVSRWLNER